MRAFGAENSYGVKKPNNRKKQKIGKAGVQEVAKSVNFTGILLGKLL